jgi:hypothetical protein
MEQFNQSPDTTALPDSGVGSNEGRPRVWTWPDPGTRFGAIFYAVVGGLAVWLLVDVLPQHLYVRWR